LNSSSKSHNSKVSASDSQLTPTEGFVIVDIEGVWTFSARRCEGILNDHKRPQRKSPPLGGPWWTQV